MFKFITLARAEKLAKVGSVVSNATLIGIEVYRLVKGNGTTPPNIPAS